MKKGQVLQGLLLATVAIIGGGYFVYGSIQKIANANGKSEEVQKASDQAAAKDPSASVADLLPKESPEEAPKVSESKVKHLIPDPARTLFLLEPVMANAEEMARQLTVMGKSKEPIYILIDSPGGSVIAGAMLLSAMEASKAPVYTVCLKLCASMAAVIHQYGDKRFMVDRAILMFHPASIGGGSPNELDKTVSFLKTLQRYIDKQTAFIAKRSGMKFEELKNLESRELWIDAEDSLVKNLSDSTVSVEFTPPPPSLEGLFGSGSEENKNVQKLNQLIWE